MAPPHGKGTGCISGQLRRHQTNQSALNNANETVLPQEGIFAGDQCSDFQGVSPIHSTITTLWLFSGSTFLRHLKVCLSPPVCQR